MGKIRFTKSSAISITTFYAAKELAKITKEEGTDAIPKMKKGITALKKGGHSILIILIWASDFF